MPITLTVIHATARDFPPTRDRIEWKLITNLSVACKGEVIEKLEWCAAMEDRDLPQGKYHLRMTSKRRMEH